MLNNAEEILKKLKEMKRKEWIIDEILEIINERRYKNASGQRGIK